MKKVKKAKFVSSLKKEKKVRPRVPDYELDCDFEEYEDDEATEEELRSARIIEMLEEINEFIDCRPDFMMVDVGDGWALIAKIVSIRINKVSNASGFQPFEQTSESRKCLLTVVEFGSEPRKGDFSYLLKRRGCPHVKIFSKYDIAMVLDGI